MEKVNKLGWFLFIFLSLGVGLYPLLYTIMDESVGLLSSKPPELLQDLVWKSAFYGHITLGGISLLVGWTQFIDAWRAKWIHWHRRMGKIYVISVLISGICSLYIGYFATGGWISQTGFILLGLIWLGTTYLAYSAIRLGQVNRHRIYMIYSFAACFAAVTLRLWLPMLTSYFGAFEPAYQIVAWLSWVPNLLIAHWMVKKIPNEK